MQVQGLQLLFLEADEAEGIHRANAPGRGGIQAGLRQRSVGIFLALSSAVGGDSRSPGQGHGVGEPLTPLGRPLTAWGGSTGPGCVPHHPRHRASSARCHPGTHRAAVLRGCVRGPRGPAGQDEAPAEPSWHFRGRRMRPPHSGPRRPCGTQAAGTAPVPVAPSLPRPRRRTWWQAGGRAPRARGGKLEISPAEPPLALAAPAACGY